MISTGQYRSLLTDVFASQRTDTNKSNSAALTDSGLTAEPPEQRHKQFSSLGRKQQHRKENKTLGKKEAETR